MSQPLARPRRCRRGLDEQPAEQGNEDGGYGGGAVDAQISGRARRAGGEGGHTAVVTAPSTVQRGARGSRRWQVRGRGDADAGQARHYQQAAAGPGHRPGRSCDEIAAADQEDAAGHDPPVGSAWPAITLIVLRIGL